MIKRKKTMNTNIIISKMKMAWSVGSKMGNNINAVIVIRDVKIEEWRIRIRETDDFFLFGLFLFFCER